MSKNLFATRNGNLAFPLPVPAGTLPGAVVFIGSILAYVLTERATTANINDFSKNVPQGLKDGEASCELVNISLAVNLLVATAVTLGALVYRVRADGTYTAAADTGGTTPVSHDRIGYALAAQAAAGTIPVALSKS